MNRRERIQLGLLVLAAVCCGRVAYLAAFGNAYTMLQWLFACVALIWGAVALELLHLRRVRIGHDNAQRHLAMRHAKDT